MMGRRYRPTLERLDGTIWQPLPTRLARKLLDACRTELQLLPPDTPIQLQLSQENLGHMLGASRQSINKILKEWEAVGVLEVRYRSLLMRDLGQLEELIDSEGD